MKQTIAGISILIAWTVIDAVAHRLALAPLYDSNLKLFRQPSEINPFQAVAVGVLLVTIFITIYFQLVSPKSLANGIYLGGLLGAALGAASGFGTYLHSPIRPSLALGWFILGIVKGLVAGAILGITAPR